MERPGERFVEPEIVPSWQNPVLLVCPRCQGLAIARDVEEHRPAARLVCGGCGPTREWQGTELHALVRDQRRILARSQHGWVDPSTGRGVASFAVEKGTDGRFGAPLWLQSTCCGGKLLWANNEAHLDYLEAFVAGRLREHEPGPAPLSARLPGWLKEAKNRDEVLRHLERLRRTLKVRDI